MKRFLLALALVCALPLSAAHANNAEERQSIQDMAHGVLMRLYKANPRAQQDIAQAAGFAVFSSADVAAIFVSGGYGHGIGHDNRNGADTYMQMAQAGVGLGLGAKTFRAVFVFDDPKAYYDFTHTGLDLSGHVDASAKQGVKGGSYTGAADVLPGVHVYQLTDTGLLAQAMLKGTKYWVDSDLTNGGPVAQNRNHYND